MCTKWVITVPNPLLNTARSLSFLPYPVCSGTLVPFSYYYHKQHYDGLDTVLTDFHITFVHCHDCFHQPLLHTSLSQAHLVISLGTLANAFSRSIICGYESTIQFPFFPCFSSIWLCLWFLSLAWIQTSHHQLRPPDPSLEQIFIRFMACYTVSAALLLYSSSLHWISFPFKSWY